MFRYQLEDIRRTCEKLVKRRFPPTTVFILKEQADYMEVPYINRGLPPGVAQERQRIQAESEMPPGKPYGPIVTVKFLDLYRRAMQGDIKGVDETTSSSDSRSKQGD